MPPTCWAAVPKIGPGRRRHAGVGGGKAEFEAEFRVQARIGSERSAVDKDAVVMEFGKGSGAAQVLVLGSRAYGGPSRATVIRSQRKIRSGAVRREPRKRG
jgi:hypothetical protein